MYHVYVLYNIEQRKTYVGYARDLASQLTSHNSLATKGCTLHYRTWMLLHVEKFVAKKSAILRERELKSGKGREFIKGLINQKYR